MTARPAELILDTHLWLWLVRDDPQLKEVTRRMVDEASADGVLMLSAISIWEIAMLAARGRIKLNAPVRKWVNVALAVPGLGLAEITPGIMIEAYELPGHFHGDPADRMIVATARVRNATLVTRDRRIIDYGALGHVEVMVG